MIDDVVILDEGLVKRNKPIVKVRRMEADLPLPNGKTEKRMMKDLTGFINDSEEIKVMGAEVIYLE